jgi:hypothetical protein
MISTRKKEHDKEHLIIARQQRKLSQKYNSTDDPKIKFDCLRQLHDLTLALANLQFDGFFNLKRGQV